MLLRLLLLLLLLLCCNLWMRLLLLLWVRRRRGRRLLLVLRVLHGVVSEEAAVAEAGHLKKLCSIQRGPGKIGQSSVCLSDGWSFAEAHVLKDTRRPSEVVRTDYHRRSIRVIVLLERRRLAGHDLTEEARAPLLRRRNERERERESYGRGKSARSVGRTSERASERRASAGFRRRIDAIDALTARKVSCGELDEPMVYG